MASLHEFKPFFSFESFFTLSRDFMAHHPKLWLCLRLKACALALAE
jgi:hypothetical protein